LMLFGERSPALPGRDNAARCRSFAPATKIEF
jgi:hypothetical protein